MRLPSFLQRKQPADRETVAAAASVADEGDAVLAARTRARRRLIGAVVLLGIGIVGFPLLFETQPRPLGAEIPIQIVDKAAAPLPPVSTSAPAPQPTRQAEPAPTPAAVPPVRPLPPPPLSEPVPSPGAVITERAGEAGIEVPPPKAAPSAPTTTATTASPKAAASSPSKAVAAAAKPAASVSPPPAAKPTVAVAAARDDGARAQALLNGAAASGPANPAGPASTPAAVPGGSRFVVQVGAYTDASALREARQKVERLGLKTYTQQVETETGTRTRVRVGPFASRKEAEAAVAKLKAAGLPTGLLAL